MKWLGRQRTDCSLRRKTPSPPAAPCRAIEARPAADTNPYNYSAARISVTACCKLATGSFVGRYSIVIYPSYPALLIAL